MLSSQIDAHVSRILGFLNLVDSQSKAAESLRRVNKRQLCIAMAIVGYLKLTVFDETSDGLDLLAIRSFSRLLKMLVLSGERSLTVRSVL